MNDDDAVPDQAPTLRAIPLRARQRHRARIMKDSNEPLDAGDSISPGTHGETSAAASTSAEADTDALPASAARSHVEDHRKQADP